MRKLWEVRELSTVAILALEIAFFAWYLWPDSGRSHPFLNAANGLLILKYSSIYGIASIGAAIVIISGGIDLSPGAVIALAGVVAGSLYVEGHWSLTTGAAAGMLAGLGCGASCISRHCLHSTTWNRSSVVPYRRSDAVKSR